MQSPARGPFCAKKAKKILKKLESTKKWTNRHQKIAILFFGGIIKMVFKGEKSKAFAYGGKIHEKICALVLALGLFVSLLPVQEAYGLGILDSVANLFGSDEKKDNEIPSMDDAFTGETIQVTVNGKKLEVHKNFYDAMTAYEEYFDKYIEIMQDGDVSVTETLSFLNQYTEMMAALEAIEDADMSKDEDAYYLHVMNSINEKLLAAS